LTHISKHTIVGRSSLNPLLFGFTHVHSGSSSPIEKVLLVDMNMNVNVIEIVHRPVSPCPTKIGCFPYSCCQRLLHVSRSRHQQFCDDVSRQQNLLNRIDAESKVGALDRPIDLWTRWGAYRLVMTGWHAMFIFSTDNVNWQSCAIRYYTYYTLLYYYSLM